MFRILGDASAQYLKCTAPSYDKLGFKYSSPENSLEAFRQNYKPMKMQFSLPKLSNHRPLTRAMIRDFARHTRIEHLNVKLIFKILIMAQPANNKIVRHCKTRWVKNCYLLATAKRRHNGIILDNPMTGRHDAIMNKTDNGLIDYNF